MAEEQNQQEKDLDLVMSAMRTGIFIFIAVMETFYAVNWFLKDLLISLDYQPLHIVVISESLTLVLMILALLFLQKKIWNGLKNKTLSNYRIFVYCILLIMAFVIYNKFYGKMSFYIFSDLNNGKLDRFYEFDCFVNPYYWIYNFFTHLKYFVFAIIFSLKRVTV